MLTTEALEKSSGDTKNGAGAPIFKGLNNSIRFHGYFLSALVVFTIIGGCDCIKNTLTKRKKDTQKWEDHTNQKKVRLKSSKNEKSETAR